MTAAATLARWQNNPSRNRAAVAKLIAEHGTLAPEVSRGMVVSGTLEAVSARFTGPVTLVPSSFTELDAVADEFASLDAQVPADAVRVKIWTNGARGVPVLRDGDKSFSWEREWVLAGDFTGSVEVDDEANVVVVTLVPLGK